MPDKLKNDFFLGLKKEIAASKVLVFFPNFFLDYVECGHRLAC
jgi:hypothetical protein